MVVMRLHTGQAPEQQSHAACVTLRGGCSGRAECCASLASELGTAACMLRPAPVYRHGGGASVSLSRLQADPRQPV